MMKVAIIGAGIAGLSCAHELESHGIEPVIYERNSFIGGAYPHVAALLPIIHRPIASPLEYLHKSWNIDLTPLNPINTIIHRSPDRTAIARGNLGYLFKHLREPDALIMQLYNSLKNPRPVLNAFGDYAVLSKKYDYVVIATGNPYFTRELGCWQERFKAFVRGALVLGDFDPNTVIMWLNTRYARNGYAYLTPFGNKRASIVLIVSGAGEKEIDHYWELFLYTENIKYTVIEEFKLEKHAGFAYPHRLDNMFFTGVAGGSTDPFLGFGLVTSIATGVAAARTIAEGKNYEKQIRPLIHWNERLHRFRKAFDNLDNRGFDTAISLIGLPGVKQLLYRTPFNAVKYGAFLLKSFSKQ